MTTGERLDRRSAGVQRVIVTDGNGGREDTYQFNVKRARALVGFMSAVFTLLLVVGGAVMGGVKYGISSEVHTEVEGATELVDEIQEIVEDNIADADIERQEQHDLGIRLEERQIAMEKKMADDRADLIREIQRAGGT